jgi:hypothetical protein
VATPGALAALEKSGQSPMEFLTRHVTGDWGAIPEEDRKENQFSLEKGFRLLSSYRTTANESTLAGQLARFIPVDERILLIEDTAELQLRQSNLVRFEARQAQNSLPAVAIRDLLKAALRRRSRNSNPTDRGLSRERKTLGLCTPYGREGPKGTRTRNHPLRAPRSQPC